MEKFIFISEIFAIRKWRNAWAQNQKSLSLLAKIREWKGNHLILQTLPWHWLFGFTSHNYSARLYQVWILNSLSSQMQTPRGVSGVKVNKCLTITICYFWKTTIIIRWGNDPSFSSFLPSPFSMHCAILPTSFGGIYWSLSVQSVSFQGFSSALR